MTNWRWRTRIKAVLKPWVPARALSFYRQFREPLRLPDRSEVILFADADTLPNYHLRQPFSPDLPPAADVESVTLIATVYNEADNVARWLDSLLSQRRIPDEIVITDGGSTDSTPEILRKYAADFPVHVRVIAAPGANIARGRNLAIAAASHKIIACSDCGSVLDENWLHALTLPFALDPQIAVSAGYYDVLETNTLSRLARRFFGVDLDAIDPQKFLPSGRSLAFRKRLWAEAGGYPEWLTDAGEDTLFDMRLKAQPARWAFVPAARVAWYAPDTLRKLLKTYFRYSRGDGETGASAELYWHKVVELLRLWSQRVALALVGLALTLLWGRWSWLYWGGWLMISMLRLLRENAPMSRKLGVRFFPYTLLLEMVGTTQALAFAVGVYSRPQVRARQAAFYRERLGAILEQHPLRKGVVVYPPTHDWGFMFQRPHQMAHAFARQGWLYFYCTANERTDAVFGFQKTEPGLYLAHIPLDVFQALGHPVVYLGSAWNRSALTNFDNPTVIYDHYDDLEVSGARPEDHFALLRQADVVLVTARRLLDAVLPYHSDALLVPNGVDYAFIQQSRPSPGDEPPVDLAPILASGKPIIGYSGALAEWVDYDLLAAAARQYPDFAFVLIGVNYDGSLTRSGILELSNVYWLGMKNYAVLFRYVWRFDVSIIPFQVNQITLATSPIKLFEYMACEKPVVTTALPECEHYEGVFFARSRQEFESYLVSALQARNDDMYLASIRAVARENTWEQRAATIIARLL